MAMVAVMSPPVLYEMPFGHRLEKSYAGPTRLAARLQHMVSSVRITSATPTPMPVMRLVRSIGSQIALP